MNRPIAPPPAELIPWPLLREQLARHAELVQARQEARIAITTTRNAAVEAAEADKAKLAEALRTGAKKEPTPTLPAAVQAEKDAAARAEAFDQAVAESEQQLVELIAEHRDEWASDVDDQAAEARQQARVALSEFAVAFSRWAAVQDVASFLANPARKPAARAWGNRPVPDLLSLNGEPYGLDRVLTALRGTIDPPDGLDETSWSADLLQRRDLRALEDVQPNGTRAA
jgi:hypothetical protein